VSTPRIPLVVFASLAALSFAIAPSAARAQAPSDGDAVALAETLFTEGKRLMNEGRFAEACPKLAESQRLDPGGGTLLNLAACHEAEGKTATAWAEFKEALAVAKRDGRSDREELARDHIASLETKLSRVAIALAPGADAPDLALAIDEHALARPAWQTPFPIDPGPHALAASAPGKRRWQAPFSVAPAETKSLVVPPLELEPTAPQPSVAHPSAATATQPPPGLPDDRNRARRVMGFAAVGAGVTAIAVGAHFGLVATSKKSDSDDACPNGACTVQGVALNDDAKAAARAADVFFVAGAVLAAGSVLLVLASPPRRAARAPAGRAHVAPRVGLGRVGLEATW
jgi:hypothetical protein